VKQLQVSWITLKVDCLNQFSTEKSSIFNILFNLKIMNIEKKYDIIGFGEAMIRFTAPDHAGLNNHHIFL